MEKPKSTFWSAQLRQIHTYKDQTSGYQLGERMEAKGLNCWAHNLCFLSGILIPSWQVDKMVWIRENLN